MDGHNKIVDVEHDNQYGINESAHEPLCPQMEFPEQPFQWINVFSESMVTLIMSFIIIYFILEVNEVSNERSFGKYRMLNNYIETVYLLVAFIGIIIHLHRFRWDQNSFYPVPFDNYPMLVAMVMCALIDTAYYFTKYLSIFTEVFDWSSFFSTSSELLFVVSILPYVAVSVCNNIGSGNPVLDQRAKITLLLAIGGCLLVFMRKVCNNIEKDVWKITILESSSQNNSFIHNAISNAEDILEVVDITYILIGLIFLIDPLRYLNVKTGEDDEEDDGNSESTTTISRTSVRQSLSFMRFRWPTFVLSNILVTILLLFSYLIKSIESTKGFNQNWQVAYLSLFMATHIAGIFYATVYYFYDIKQWPKRDSIYTRNDGHFNMLTSSFQMVYSTSMSLSLMYLNTEKNATISNISIMWVEMINFVLTLVQVLIQAGCINSAIRRQATKNGMTTWRSRLFPPIALAFSNFGYLATNIAYSKIFIPHLESSRENLLIYVVIKDLALPILTLHRLYGMAFFINLSIQQWQG